MLILTRKPGESLYIGDTIKITIVEIKGHQIRVGIEAPKEQRIYREEIYKQIEAENRSAAVPAGGEAAESLAGISAAWAERKGESAPSDGLKPRTKGLAAFSSLGGTQKVAPVPQTEQPRSEPQVIVRRKRKKAEEEE